MCPFPARIFDKEGKGRRGREKRDSRIGSESESDLDWTGLDYFFRFSSLFRLHTPTHATFHLLPSPKKKMDTDQDGPDIQTLCSTLTHQATTLLSELTAFRAYLDSSSSATAPTLPRARPADTLIGKFHVDVRREVEYLRKHAGALALTLADNNDNNSSTTGIVHQRPGASPDGIHRVRSSNISFLAGVWEGLKRESGVVGVRKNVRYLLPDTGSEAGAGARGGVGTQVSKKKSREARERAKAKAETEAEAKVDVVRAEGERIRGLDGEKNEGTGHGQGHGGPRGTGSENEDVHPHGVNKRDDGTKRKTNSKGVVPRREKESVTVDIISDHGATWIKMFTKSQRWLMMDLAKEGIVDVESEAEEEGEEDYIVDTGTFPSGGPDGHRADGYVDKCGTSPKFVESTAAIDGVKRENEMEHDAALEELKLVKMTREFLNASRTARVGKGHRHPTVQFHLPKISRGTSKDVDKVLAYIQRMGVEVLTAEELHVRKGKHHLSSGTLKDGDNGSREHKLSLQQTFERMVSPSPPPTITDTLNVDCTILIALISDVSHFRQSDVQIPEHYKGNARRDIEAQLQTDIEDPLLPNHIYPILRGRRLICTRKAVEHWRKIVKIMGSPTEAARSRIFLGELNEGDLGDLSNHEMLASLSIHDMPADLQLPLEVVDFDLDDARTKADGSPCRELEMDVMRELAREPRLSSLNCSVFFHGWYRGLTTVSLNRVVSEWLDRAINVVLDNLEARQGLSSDIAEETQFRGPDILICGRERSLLGSEK